MKNRILKGWTLNRILYTVIGVAIIVQSVMQAQWFGVLLGVYFASMGIFSLGCASGSCYGGYCASGQEAVQETQIQNKLNQIKTE